MSANNTYTPPRASQTGARKLRRPALMLFMAATLAAVNIQPATAADDSILGTSDSFVVLAGAGVTNTGPTTLSGDLGTFPTTDIAGDSSIVFTSGVNHAGDAVTQGAKDDLVTGYNTVAAAGPPTSISDDLAGKVLKPGVYNSASSLGLSGELTLDAEGNPDAIFVFQAGSTITTSSASQVTLVNGARACNVFWLAGSSTTLGTDSNFIGTSISLTSATLQTGAAVEGRILARNGAVTLDTNIITAPSCDTPTSLTPTVTPEPEETPGTGETPTPEETGPTEGTPTPGVTPTPETETPVTPENPMTPPVAEVPVDDVPRNPDGSPVDETVTDSTADDNSPQVRTVPEGSVATGSGSTAENTSSVLTLSLLGMLSVAGLTPLLLRKVL